MKKELEKNLKSALGNISFSDKTPNPNNKSDERRKGQLRSMVNDLLN